MHQANSYIPIPTILHLHQTQSLVFIQEYSVFMHLGCSTPINAECCHRHEQPHGFDLAVLPTQVINFRHEPFSVISESSSWLSHPSFAAANLIEVLASPSYRRWTDLIPAECDHVVPMGHVLSFEWILWLCCHWTGLHSDEVCCCRETLLFMQTQDSIPDGHSLLSTRASKSASFLAVYLPPPSWCCLLPSYSLCLVWLLIDPARYFLTPALGRHQSGFFLSWSTLPSFIRPVPASSPCDTLLQSLCR